MIVLRGLGHDTGQVVALVTPIAALPIFLFHLSTSYQQIGSFFAGQVPCFYHVLT